MAESVVKLGAGGFSSDDVSRQIEDYYYDIPSVSEFRDNTKGFSSAASQISRLGHPTENVGADDTVYIDPYFNNSPYAANYARSGVRDLDALGRKTSIDTSEPSKSIPEATVREMWAGEMRALSNREMDGTLAPDDVELLRAYQDYFTGATGMEAGGVVSPVASTAPGTDPYLPYYEDLLPKETGAPEESGLGSVFWDKLTGDDPTAGLRESARVGGSRTAALYGSDPSFMERLITDYGYPAQPDPETGELVIPTGFEPEDVRMARPRHDLPTYPELEDARGHMLGSAIMAQEYGPETAESAGSFNEFVDRFAPFPFGGQNARDVAMDERNNAVGRQLFMKAGMDATPQQLTQMVDAEIFRQLDVIMGRSRGEQFTPAADQPRAPRNFVSPPTGPDVYFPRNEEGYFDTTRKVLGFSPSALPELLGSYLGELDGRTTQRI